MKHIIYTKKSCIYIKLIYLLLLYSYKAVPIALPLKSKEIKLYFE